MRGSWPSGRARTLLSPRARRISSVASLTLVAGSLVAAAALAKGSPVTDVSLNDGGVWVTRTNDLQVGQVNSQIKEIDQTLGSAASSFDVVQRASAVFVTGSAGEDSGLSPIDVAHGTLESSVALPADATTAMGGRTVVVADAKTGRVWVRAAEYAGSLDTKHVPDAKAGPGAGVAVGTDGTAYVFSPRHQQVGAFAIGDTGTAEVGGEQDMIVPHDDATGAESGGKGRQFSVSGDVPLAYDAASGELSWPGHDPVRLDDPDGSRLQQASPDAAVAYVAHRTGLFRIDLSSGKVEEVSTGTVDGPPAPPLVKDGCLHAAWADPGSGSAYRRTCEGEKVHTSAIPQVAATGTLVFRTNRHVVVLNDAASGYVWMVQTDDMQPLTIWDQVSTDKTPTPTKQTRVEEVRRTDRNHAPTANPDELGARPGLPTILPITANDADPDGDILTIDETKLHQTSGPVPSSRQVVGKGTQLQVVFPAKAAGQTATFDYVITDGRRLPSGAPSTSESTVKVAVRSADENAPPKLLPDRPMKLRVARGATASTYVLPAWLDPDGDDLVLRSASTKDGGTVRARPDGVITFTDDGHRLGTKQIDVVVSDSRTGGQTKGVVEVTVVGGRSLTPDLIPDSFQGVAGTPLRIDPLANDQSVDGTPLRLVNVVPAAGTVGGLTPVTDPLTGTVQVTADRPGTYYLDYKASTQTGRPSTSFIRYDVRAGDTGNRPPVAVRDQALLPAGGETLVDLLANDTDPDNDVLVVQSVSAPEDSGIKAALTDNRLLRIEAPTTDLTRPVSLTYTVTDGRAQSTGQVVVSPGQGRVNAPPTATDDYLTVRAGAVASVAVLANDSDPDGDRLTLLGSDSADGGDGVGTSATASASGSGKASDFPAFPSGSRYRLRAPGQAGSYSLVYGIADPSGLRASATIHLTVLPDTATDDKAPRPVSVVERTFSERPLRIDLPLAGSDPDGDAVTLTSVVKAPSLGRITRTGLDWVGYEPFAGQVGTDSFQLAVQDKYGATGTVSVRVGVAARAPVNQAPVALDDAVRVRPGRTITVNAVGNDHDPDGDQITVLSVSPAKGTKARADGGQVVVAVPPLDGDQRTAKESVGYRITDGLGATSTASIEVTGDPTAPLYAPVTKDDTAALDKIVGKKAGDTVDVDVLKNDADVDGPVSALTAKAVDPGTTVIGRGRLRITLARHDQVAAYRVTDGDGRSSYGFVFVAGTDKTPPVVNASAVPVKVTAGQQRRLVLGDYVLVRPGRRPLLTSGDTVQTQPRTTGKKYVDEHTLLLAPPKDAYGKGSITFQVTDGQRVNDPAGLQALLSIPVDIEPSGPVPPTLRSVSLEVPLGAKGTTLDLRALASDPNKGQADRLDYQVSERGTADTSVSGRKLVVKAGPGVQAGDTTRMAIQAKDPDGKTARAQVLVHFVDSTAPPLLVGAIEVKGSVGKPVSVDVADHVTYDPFPGESFEVTSASVESGKGTADASGTTVRATPQDGGVMTVRFVVTDALKRPTVGRMRVVVAGKPAAPGRPTVSAVASQTITLTWAAAKDNGSPVTSYRVTGGGVDKQCGPATACRLDGLEDGKEYSFQVSATNAEGEGPKSGPSDPTTPDKIPETMAAPRAEATKVDGQVRVGFAPPPSGGSAIQTYEIEASGVGTKSTTAGARSFLWTSLTNGDDTTFRVRAVNEKGPGEWSPPSAPVHAYGKPFAPTGVHATSLNDGLRGGQVRVDWDGADDNGEPVTGYTIHAVSGSGISDFQVGPADRSRVFTAKNGESYAFQVVATNPAGDGPPSATSNTVVPYGQTSAPLELHKTGDSDQHSGIAWQKPADTGGLTVKGYRVDSSNGRSSFVTGTSANVDFGANNGPYDVTVTPVTTKPGGGDLDGKSASVGDLLPFGDPYPATGNANGGYRSVTFTASPGASNGRDVKRVEMDWGSGWQNTSSHTTSVNQGGDQACVNIRTVAEGATPSQETYSSVSQTCGSADPRTVTVTYVAGGPSGPCTANCDHLSFTIQGFVSSHTYRWTSDIQSSNGTPSPSGTVTTGGDGRGTRSDFAVYNRNVYDERYCVFVDGVEGCVQGR